MIRPINCTSIKSFKQAQMPQQTEFEQQPQAQEFVDYAQWQKENKKPSKAKMAGRYLATQFLAGAVFSAICDGAINLYKLIKKAPVIPAKTVLSNSLSFGGLFTVMGVAFLAIGKLFGPKKSQ